VAFDGSPSGAIRAVAFDLDGTLVDSVVTAATVLNAMRVARGATPIDARPLAPLLSLGVTALVRGGLADCARDEADDIAEFRERYAVLPPEASPLFPDALSVLRTLCYASLSLAICTNKSRRLTEKVLRDTGLTRLAQVVVAGDDPGIAPKPAPDQLAESARRLGAIPATLAFVGDSLIDQRAARAFGCDFFLANYGYASGDENRATATASLASLADLPALLGLSVTESVARTRPC
jgi:phosphoglycolate phosphatase